MRPEDFSVLSTLLVGNYKYTLDTHICTHTTYFYILQMQTIPRGHVPHSKMHNYTAGQ